MTILEQKALQAVSELPVTIKEASTPNLLTLAGMAMQGILSSMNTPLYISKHPELTSLLADSSLACAEALMNAYKEKIKNK